MYYKHVLKSKAHIYTEPFILKGAKELCKHMYIKGRLPLIGRQGISSPAPVSSSGPGEEHTVSTDAGLCQLRSRVTQ